MLFLTLMLRLIATALPNLARAVGDAISRVILARATARALLVAANAGRSVRVSHGGPGDRLEFDTTWAPTSHPTSVTPAPGPDVETSPTPPVRVHPGPAG